MSPRRRRLALALAATLIAPPLMAWAAFAAAVRWWPYPAELAVRPPASTLVLDRAGRPLAAYASPRGDWHLPLRDIAQAPLLARALVAVEDHRFAQHAGIDWRAVAGAALQDILARRTVRGASTITMQVERLRSMRERSLATKLVEAVRARQLERAQGKDALLAEYLDRAPFGGNLVGAEAASWRWFGLPCRALNLAQAALLAGLPQNPGRLRPDLHPEAARARRDHVLARMRACGVISETERLSAQAEPVGAAWHPLPQAEVDDALAPLLESFAGVPGVVATTIDAGIAAEVAAAARARLAELAGSGIGGVAVVVVDTASGDVLAAVSLGGGRLDLAGRARSTGSVLKPFIYAAAFAEDWCAPGSLLDDAPGAWGAYAPDDYDRSFLGKMTAAEALALSRNLPAIALAARVGIARVGGTMEACGLTGAARQAPIAGAALAVGGIELSPWTVAAGYACLARGGVQRPLRLRRDAATAAAGQRALPARACWQVLACLDDPQRTAAICPAAARVAPAWKTGTSSGHRDAWCAAVTPRLTIVGWLGDPRGAPSPALVGQEAAAPLVLGLIAALDPGGPGFPDPPLTTPIAPPPPVIAPALAITTPGSDGEITIDPDLDPRGQRLPLRCAGARGACWWFVDGAPIAAGDDGARWWAPTPGAHELRVVDAEGRAAIASVMVHAAP